MISAPFFLLSHLRGFLFNHLKIDSLFVHDVVGRSDPRAVVRGIATLAEGMRIEIAAEGVKSAAQLHVVRVLCALA